MIFKPLKWAYFFGHFPLVPPIKNLRKWPILVSLPNLTYRNTAGTFTAAACAKMFSKDCTLSAYYLGDSPVCAEVIFKLLKSAYFFGHFPSVPSIRNFRKWPILVSLPNLPYRNTAGTSRAAASAKMFSKDCTLSAY